MNDRMSKKRASILNMACMGIYQLITALFGFILPNLILNTYGANLHGYTSTVSTIMGYIALINAGLAPAAVQALYAPLAQNDTRRINEVVNAINRFYKISGCLYTVAVVVVAGVLPFILSNQLPSFMVVSLMLVIGASNTLECFIYSKYRVLLQADQRLFVVSFVDVIVYLIRVVSQVILIKFGASIIFVMGVPTIMIVLRMLGLSKYCKKHYPQLDKKIKPDMSALNKRWSAMLHQLGGLVVYNTDVTLLTLFGSLVQVSIYSVYNLVFTHLYQFLTNIFSHGTVASFGRIISEKNRPVLLRTFDLYEYGYYLMVTFIYGVTASMILPFVSVYTKHYAELPYVDVKLAILFMIIGVANNLRVPCITMINAAGHFKETQWRSILEAVINIVISLALIKPFGMYGLLIGTVCSFAYRTTDIIFYSHRHILMTSCKKTLLRILRSVIVILVCVGIYYGLIGEYILSSWGQWIMNAVICSLITGFVTLAVYALTEPKTFVSCVRMFSRGNKNIIKKKR